MEVVGRGGGKRRCPYNQAVVFEGGGGGGGEVGGERGGECSVCRK